MTDAELLAQPLTLPCGLVLKNRLAKSAMSERLGTPDNHATSGLATLYGRWADGGLGLCITGNVMIDRKALGEPCNVALEDDSGMAALDAWARAGSRNSTSLWMQLNHPGRQVPRGLNVASVSPSPVPFAPALASVFATPRELTEPEIEDLIARFGRSAGFAKQAGFAGVQIHGAHGYLVSQFLSPHTNHRTDAWGGDAERRARFVVRVYEAMRAAVGPAFPLGIKLNSADFQRGGFTEEESLDVIDRLDGLAIDLIEVSGGTYEAPAMAGIRADSTRKREAYFLDFADRVRARTKVPLMVTGGFRSAKGMAEALRSGALDLVGLARPLAIDPNFPNRLLAGEDVTSPVSPRRTGIKAIDRAAVLEVSWYERQLGLMAAGHEPQPDENLLLAAAKIAVGSGWDLFRSRRTRA